MKRGLLASKNSFFVTSRGKSALEDYFDHAPDLEASLRKSGKIELLEILKETNMDSGAIAYMRQHKPLGLGHAVWCARRLIGNEPFAVILPDDVIAAEKPCLQQMVEAYQETGGSMVATMEVAPEKTSSYGVVDIESQEGPLVKLRGMVEKPNPEDAPSNLAVIGRYILSPKIFQNFSQVEKGAGGELQLTDAIAQEFNEGRDVFGYRFEGKRYDCGSKAGYLQAMVAFALDREDLREEFGAYLEQIVAKRAAGQ